MESGDMALMAATLNDPAKAARLEEIMAAQKRADDTMASAQALMQKAEETLDAARKEHSVADAKLQEARDLVDSIVEKEAELGRVQTAQNAEKTAFETVRAAVRREHHDRNANLITRQVAIEKREREMTMRENAVSPREAAVKASADSLAIKHAALAEIISKG